MKTNFKFFFYLILTTTFLSATFYGLAQGLVERYMTVFSFGLLGVIVIGIAGMMRSLAPLPGAEI